MVSDMPTRYQDRFVLDLDGYRIELIERAA